MKRIIVIILLQILGFALYAQNSITLTFTGRNQHDAYVRLEYVNIQNMTRGWLDNIYFPDTVYTLTVNTGVDDYMLENEIRVMPNPFEGRTQINLHSIQKESVKMMILDVSGKKYAEYYGNLLQGDNLFEVSLTTPQTYVLTIQTSEGYTLSVKMVNTGHYADNRIIPMGVDDCKKVEIIGSKSHDFELGDEMCYTGYCRQGDYVLTSVSITQNQYENENVKLYFTTCEIPQLSISGDTSIYYGMSTILTVSGAETYVWNTGETTPSITVAPTSTTTYTVTGTNGSACANTADFTIVVQPVLPTVITNSVSNITYNTAECGGDVINDGGAAVIARGVCWSPNPLPTINDEHTTDGSGVGAFTSTLTGLTHSTYYFVRSYAINSEGTVYGNQEVLMTETPVYGQPCPGMETITDYDGNVYNTVRLGTQCWMAENLRSTHFADGTAITFDSNGTNSMTVPYCYAPLGNANLIPRFSYLYNWAAVMHGASSSNSNPSEVQGICPTGWHVPSDAEWNQLIDYVGSRSEFSCGGQTDNIAKALASNTEWGASTIDCAVGYNQIFNNITGFSALPAGGFFNLGYTTSYDACFWSSTSFAGNQARFAHIKYNLPDVNLTVCDALNGFSVRCLSDSVFVVGRPCPGMETMSDFDGNVYNTVQIGTQCWMKENLRTTHYADGTAIPAGLSSSNTASYRYAPNNSESMVSEYGYLYTWRAVVRNDIDQSNENIPSGVQGVCPTGWHVPSDAEWLYLANHVSYQSGYACGGYSGNNGKALAASTDWSTSANSCAVGNILVFNNATGFSAKPAGSFFNDYYNHHNYQDFGSVAYFWSSTPSWELVSKCQILGFDDTQINSDIQFNGCGFSVRCVLDPEIINTDTSYGQPCSGTDPLMDYDGNEYRTVQIGSQCWMAENLRTTHYSDGTVIPFDSTFAGSYNTPLRHIPNDYLPYVPVYGYLYNRRAVTRGASSTNANPSGVQGICPNGWHVPSNAEWVQLGNYVTSQSGYACNNGNAKALASRMGWNWSSGTCHPGNNPTANNATGFSALPAGVYVGSTRYFGEEARFWTTTTNSSSATAYFYRISYNSTVLNSTVDFQSDGYSVRCVRN